MKVLKIKEGGIHKMNENFAYSHCFSMRIKSGFLSSVDARVMISTNLSEITIDEVVNAIESQDKSIMREILSTLGAKNKVFVAYIGRKSFITKIRNDDCEFYFRTYEAIDYAVSNPANWKNISVKRK